MAAAWSGQAEGISSSQPAARRPRFSSAPLQSGLSLTSTLSVETAWTTSDIVKAGRLLATPPLTHHFDDEKEMRRIYSLVYDVFRYRSVLKQALTDTAFFDQYPQFQKQANIVCLLFYDLYKRRFLPRDPHDEEFRDTVFKEVGLLEADTQLWDTRVRLAAALSRLRIKNNALQLSQLLPPRLRDERVFALREAPAAAWINTFKIDTNEVTRVLEKAGLKLLPRHESRLDGLSYAHDDLCPKFIKFHPTLRSDLAQSALLRQHNVVLQDRAFCLGPAVMCKVLQELDLAGTVIQTQINSPRAVAYLANILWDNERIESLIAFGAGHRKGEYEEYLRCLGVGNVKVRAERFVDISSGSALLQNVVAVLATPNNTYSGVIDPVDLACGRGGDLAMLEMLTDTGDGTLERVNAVLEEQRQTLRLSMSRPQIQVVLYQTHSVISAENRDMVTRMVSEINNSARVKHVEEQVNLLATSKKEPSDITAASGVDTIVAPSSGVVSFPSADGKYPGRFSLPEADIAVPPCDIFELHALPVLTSDGDTSVTLEEEGCYLAYVRRKEIVRLNAKYMINIAESRGLFGGEGAVSKDSSKSQSGRQQPKKSGLQRSTSGTPPLIRTDSRRLQLEIERIAAPTFASILRRATFPGNVQGTAFRCLRHRHRSKREATRTFGVSPKIIAKIKREDARRWWVEAARHVMMFGFSLALCQNVFDESLRPRLKLTRTRPWYRTPLPVSVTSIYFDDSMF